MMESALAQLANHAYAFAFLIALVDATGVPFPGRILLIGAGSLARSADASLPVLIALAAAGAMLGDHAWYLAARLGRERVLALYCRLAMGSGRCLERTRRHFRRFGPLAIIGGRWFAGVRLFAWPFAASSGVGYLRFFVYDAVGAVLWASVCVLAGAALGDAWLGALDRVGGKGLAVLGALLLLATALGVRIWRRARYGPAGAVTP